MPVRGLLFDFDGTLVDSERAYDEALREVGIDPTGEPYRAARTAVKTRLGGGHVSARNRLLYFKALHETAGDRSPSRILERMASYEAALERNLRAQWTALGRGPWLSQLTTRIPAVVVTNENTRTQLIKWRAIDPDGALFRAFITSEEIGAEKPARSIFEAALAALGCAPSECLMVGDDPECDIEPALALGMRAVLCNEFTKRGDAALTIDDLRALEGILDGLD